MSESAQVHATLVGGPTVLLELDRLRLLTDPTFSPPGPQKSHSGRTLLKLIPPAVAAERVGRVDAVLLSHEQHSDNLDQAGRDFLRDVPITFSTNEAGRRLTTASVQPLEPWHHARISQPDGEPLIVTAVPARHGPDGTEASSGPVIGFVLKSPLLPTVYISGDNASLSVVAEVEHHLGPIDVAVLFAGAARTERIDAYVTLTSRQVTDAAALLPNAAIIPAHFDGWAHLREGREDLTDAIRESPRVAHRVVLLSPGRRTTIRWQE